ncbi:pentapeptide repeat-containing protein [Epibacterium ulvae]|uniref:pentapeptide repeat-containing protein n=1 Tax=Epibacterium ulvae TaxID=1156985 RepID=UPI0024909ADE|nr:pentapeptide repeat-containing protein [Epibacterium ulvae]
MTQIPLPPYVFWSLSGLGLLVFVIAPLLVFSHGGSKQRKLSSNGSFIAWFKTQYVALTLSIVFILFCLAAIFYLAEVSLSVAQIVDLLRGELNNAEPKPENIRNLAYAAATLVAVLAGSATIFFSSLRVWINERNTKATEQGLITDRINKAIEGLGADKTTKIDEKEHTEPNIEVRIGSILALERIARQNLDFHIQIMEILCAYVRQNAPCQVLLSQELTQNPKPRDDIQFCVRIIGRRSSEGKTLETSIQFRLDLSQCNLTGVKFSKGDYSGADFSDCDLSSCIFHGAQFKGARLDRSILNYCVWGYVDFTGTSLQKTVVEYPQNGDPTFTTLQHACLDGVNIANAKWTAVFSLGDKEKMNKVFGTNDTELHDRYQNIFQSKKVPHLLTELQYAKDDNDTEKINKLDQELRSLGYISWSPYTSNDLANSSIYSTLLNELNLTTFPYFGESK